MSCGTGVAWSVAGVASAADGFVGVSTLVVVLATLAVLPVAQFLCLGYLLAASGRVAISGRLLDGGIGVRQASRVGRIALGVGLSLLPARRVALLARSAEAIDPGGPVARAWRGGLVVVLGLTLVHLAGACARGGRVRHFLGPVRNLAWLAARRRRLGSVYRSARDATCDFVVALRLPSFGRLGLVGFGGSLVWLAVPVTLLTIGRKIPVLGLLGGVLLALVATTLPFLQVHLAVEGRWRAIFALGAIRARFARAPLAFALALGLTVLAATPLYLLKIELVPREVAGLASALFLVLLFPARVVCGWAYGRGNRREERRGWPSRTLGRLAMAPVALVYTGIVVLTQFTSWGGLGSLIEQHAFLLPVPFLGL